jgi:chromosome segregation ATPase
MTHPISSCQEPQDKSLVPANPLTSGLPPLLPMAVLALSIAGIALALLAALPPFIPLSCGALGLASTLLLLELRRGRSATGLSTSLSLLKTHCEALAPLPQELGKELVTLCSHSEQIRGEGERMSATHQKIEETVERLYGQREQLEEGIASLQATSLSLGQERDALERCAHTIESSREEFHAVLPSFVEETQRLSNVRSELVGLQERAADAERLLDATATKLEREVGNWMVTTQEMEKQWKQASEQAEAWRQNSLERDVQQKQLEHMAQETKLHADKIESSFKEIAQTTLQDQVTFGKEIEALRSLLQGSEQELLLPTQRSERETLPLDGGSGVPWERATAVLNAHEEQLASVQTAWRQALEALDEARQKLEKEREHTSDQQQKLSQALLFSTADWVR